MKNCRFPSAIYLFLILLGGCSHSASSQISQMPPGVHHYEYVFTAGSIYVYDSDNAGALVKTLSVPTAAGVRGAVASAATGRLYIAYGSDSGSGGSQLAYDLETDSVVWTKNYSHGVDSQSITPDGKTIYMPSGEASSGGTWYVEDSATGNDINTISTGGQGPHNTIVNAAGTHVYFGERDLNLSNGAAAVDDFVVADTATNQVHSYVTPMKSGVRPFTFNSTETLAYIAVTGFLGFQVGNITTGGAIYTVAVDGSKIPGFTTNSSVTCPSHGIALSQDDRTLYLIDQPNSYVHVFDVSGVPASAPVQIADIKLADPISGTQAQCAYDCEKDSWLHLNRDGSLLFVGDSQDVIDTSTKQVAMKLPQMANSRIEIEIDFQGTVPVWAMRSRSSTGGTAGQ